MSITPHFNFDPSLKWANGAGCLKCGTNVSDLGREAGAQCIYLGAEDEFLGHFGLCYDCALQVALAIGYVSKESMLEVLEQARKLADEATELEQIAASESRQARLDKDTIERLLGWQGQAPDADEDADPVEAD